MVQKWQKNPVKSSKKYFMGCCHAVINCNSVKKSLKHSKSWLIILRNLTLIKNRSQSKQKSEIHWSKTQLQQEMVWLKFGAKIALRGLVLLPTATITSSSNWIYSHRCYKFLVLWLGSVRACQALCPNTLHTTWLDQAKRYNHSNVKRFSQIKRHMIHISLTQSNLSPIIHPALNAALLHSTGSTFNTSPNQILREQKASFPQKQEE